MSLRTFAKSFLPLTLVRLLAGSELQLVTSGLVDGLLNTKTLSRLSQDAFRVDSMVSVLKVLMNTALGLQRDYDNCLKLFVPKLSKGIASIPDELVALIFKFATRQENTLKQTVRLSHVSKRFRRIALAEHCLWATLRTGSSTEELEARIARGGHNTDLHVVIHLIGIRFFDSILPAFMDVCWPTAPRWKTLTVSKAEEMSESDVCDEEVDDVLSDVCDEEVDDVLTSMDLGYDLQLVRLHELYIRHYQDGLSVGGGPRFKLSWTSPNLRVLRCSEYLPLHSSTFSALSSVETSINFEGTSFAADLRKLSSFLSSTPTVTNLDLQLFGYTIPKQSKFAHFWSRSITSFGLHLPDFKIEERRSRFVSSFIRALRIPNLEELSFSIDFHCADLLTRYDRQGKSAEVLAEPAHPLRLLPDPCAHPQLRSFTFKFGSSYFREHSMHKSFTNFSRILTSFVQTHFTPGGSSVQVVGRDNLWSLQELRLRGCQKLKGEVLQETIQSLKNIGVWDGFDLFVLEDHEALDHIADLFVLEGRDQLIKKAWQIDGTANLRFSN